MCAYVCIYMSVRIHTQKLYYSSRYVIGIYVTHISCIIGKLIPKCADKNGLASARYILQVTSVMYALYTRC